MAQMRDDLAELWRYKHLLRMLVMRELKIRYKNSVLGFLWSIVPPLLTVLVMTFLFRKVLGVGAHNMGAYLLCGIIPWNFFSTALLDSSQSILINYPLIKKIYFPRETIPLASVISNFVHFMLGWCVYFCAFAMIARFFGAGIPILPRMVWFPVIVLFQAILVTGLSLYVSALNVFYEDVKFILQEVFRLVYFLLPILVPSDNIYYSMSAFQRHPWLYKLYLLNPITAFINAYRHVLLEPIRPHEFKPDLSVNVPPLPFDWSAFAVSCLLSVLIAYGGYRYFNSRKWQFVERA